MHLNFSLFYYLFHMRNAKCNFSYKRENWNAFAIISWLVECSQAREKHEKQISIKVNILLAAFARADPKSTKKTDNLTIFVAHLGFVCVKAAHRMLVKWTPDFDKSQHFTSSFCARRSRKHKEDWQLDYLCCAFGICMRKSCS